MIMGITAGIVGLIIFIICLVHTRKEEKERQEFINMQVEMYLRTQRFNEIYKKHMGA